ncbi:Integrase catalytic region, partial [mine drainage metagenome]
VPECKGYDVAKKGFRYNKSGKKQKYFCTRCKNWFVVNDGFKGMHFVPKIITRAVHMYCNGMPISKVQNHLQQHDGVKVSDVSILDWVKKYAPILKKVQWDYSRL